MTSGGISNYDPRNRTFLSNYNPNLGAFT